MNKTSIEWTDYTWNAIRARINGSPHRRTGTFCTRISPGCANCYASVINKRFGNGLEYAVPNLEKVEFFIDEKILEEPLRRKKPARIFVGDMFDLFHEAIPDQLIWRVLIQAREAKQHTFQFLTKRARRMREMISFAATQWTQPSDMGHFWFGVSVEDKKRAEERIPELLKTPATVRFLSVEPLLEDVNLHLPPRDCSHPSMDGDGSPCPLWKCSLCDGYVLHQEIPDKPGFVREIDGIHWVICGGESGPGARPFNLAWAEQLLEQCRAAGVPFFLKQIGSNSYWFSDDRLKRIAAAGADGFTRQSVRDRKGGNPEEWPEIFRVREFPSQKAEVVHG